MKTSNNKSLLEGRLLLHLSPAFITLTSATHDGTKEATIK